MGLQGRVKLLNFVQSAFKKKDAEDDVPDEDTIVKTPALVRDGIMVHTKDAPEIVDSIESTEEKYVPDAVLKEMNKNEVDSKYERAQSVSEASLQVGLDMDKVTDMSKPLSVNKT